METSMYHDDGSVTGASSLKKTMTLDFSGCNSKQNRFQSLLASPDLHLLRLGSPELEKMLMQANASGIVATPTPTQFIYPRYAVTEEQEAYARGFVEALAELHQGRFASDAGGINEDQNSACSTYSTLQPLSLPVSSCSTTQQVSGVIQSRRSVPSDGSVQMETFAGYSPSPPSIKEEPQTVPSSPPTSPVNMEVQEKIKLDRKRARNRIAARKCRTRKMERIARLEEKVASLKSKNAELSAAASSLHDQLALLKQQIGEHVKRGCHFNDLPSI